MSLIYFSSICSLTAVIINSFHLFVFLSSMFILINLSYDHPLVVLPRRVIHS